MKHWGWINFILTAMKSKYTQNCGILNGREFLFKMVFCKKNQKISMDMPKGSNFIIRYWSRGSVKFDNFYFVFKCENVAVNSSWVDIINHWQQ